MEILNTFCPALPVSSAVGERGACLMAVLAGEPMAYAVYVGLVSLPRPGADTYQHARALAANWVSAHGTKQTYRQALYFFPSLTEGSYKL